jgi:hypothetical protein
VADALSLRLILAALVGWLDQRQQDTVAYLIEETASSVDTCAAGSA